MGGSWGLMAVINSEAWGLGALDWKAEGLCTCFHHWKPEISTRTWRHFLEQVKYKNGRIFVKVPQKSTMSFLYNPDKFNCVKGTLKIQKWCSGISCQTLSGSWTQLVLHAQSRYGYDRHNILCTNQYTNKYWFLPLRKIHLWESWDNQGRRMLCAVRELSPSMETLLYNTKYKITFFMMIQNRIEHGLTQEAREEYYM